MATAGGAGAAAEVAAQKAANGAFKLCSCLADVTKKCCGVFGAWVKKLPAPVIGGLLRVFNLANAVLLGFASWYSFGIAAGNITRTFLAVYIGMFGVLLALFETRVKFTSPFIRRNFGFLFTYSGRTAFLVFLGAVCFGMLGDDVKGTDGYNWCVGVGIATLCNALFNCFIICNHPEYQKLNAASQEPAGNDPSKMSEQQVKAYLSAHPEVAAAALGGAKGGPGGAPDGDTAVTVSASGEPDWVRAAEAKSGPKGGSAAGSGGGFFGGFGGFGGGGGGKKKSAAPAPEAEYQPPVVPMPGAVPESAAVPVALPVAAPVPPTLSPRTAAPAAGGGKAFAIGDDEENPFAQ